MQSHARVVVIGGGVVGCSVLFHLAKFGWKDVMLLERSELTSGSSWHAAGMFHTLSSDPNISLMQGYTINLYRELEALSEQSVGLHITGQLYLASTRERLDYLKQERSKARSIGLDQEFVSLQEAKELNPLLDTSQYLGALYDPHDGYVDPSGVTHAYAKAARKLGATYHRHVPVIETRQRADGTWDVVTEKGTVRAEHVVNAAGLWAREVGHMAGLHLPVQPMEHHYLITESIPEVAAMDRELCSGIDYEANIYFRQEQHGLVLGTYEPEGTPWMVKGTPWDFGHELLQDDLERIADRVELAFERMPAMGRAGIKNVINGPFTFGPDGSPMIGPVPGKKNYWVAVGVMAGFCQAGGVGKCLAEWMIEGEPSIDVWAMDIARFGEFASHEYGTVKATENYGRRFQLTYPNEELPAMRQQKTTAIYDRLVEHHGVMGVSFGLEHALWFADSKTNAYEEPTFRRSNAFPYVSREVRTIRNGVGALEIANFGKHLFRGPGARNCLDRLLANHLPPPGRMVLTPMLTPKGRLYGDLTVACLDDETFYLFGSGVAQEMHRRWFLQHLPESGVHYSNVSDELHGIALSGPQSRDLLSQLTREDLASANCRFLDFRACSVAGVPVLLARISFSGELGYELYCAPQYQRKLFQEVMRVSVDFDFCLYGSRALMSLRLEKNWGVWTLDYRPEFTPLEAGLDGFVAYAKRADFVGKAAAIKQRAEGAERRLVTLVVDAAEVDCAHDEAVMHNGECVSYVTSGGFAHFVNKSVAMAYVPIELARPDTQFEVEILGEMRPALIQAAPLYDPTGSRMRS